SGVRVLGPGALMQQRQLRLGDVLDDYCPRERRLTNHAVVAMIGDEVKLTRCTACDTEHDYKQGKVPRQRRKTDTPAALYAQVLAGGPKKVTHEAPAAAPAQTENAPVADDGTDEAAEPETAIAAAAAKSPMSAVERGPVDNDGDDREDAGDDENEGPV